MTYSSTATLPAPPQIMDGNTVYDMIMSEIEPDLTTKNIATLEEKYSGETEQETEFRAERYKAAFLEYKKRYAEYKAKMEEEVRNYGRTLITAVEHQANTNDASALDELESAISNS